MQPRLPCRRARHRRPFLFSSRRRHTTCALVTGVQTCALPILPTVQPELAGDFGTLMEWADKVRRLKVRANAETPLDCQTARDFGAEGVGLCRTEHMFFDTARITAVLQMILADTEKGRREALAKLLPEQRSDFTGIFLVMAGLPVTKI